MLTSFQICLSKCFLATIDECMLVIADGVSSVMAKGEVATDHIEIKKNVIRMKRTIAKREQEA